MATRRSARLRHYHGRRACTCLFSFSPGLPFWIWRLLNVVRIIVSVNVLSLPAGSHLRMHGAKWNERPVANRTAATVTRWCPGDPSDMRDCGGNKGTDIAACAEFPHPPPVGLLRRLEADLPPVLVVISLE